MKIVVIGGTGLIGSKLVEQLRKGERPMPSRGARICSLKEMQYQLAGFADERDGAIADGPAGAPTLRGVALAQEHGVAVADFNPDTPITKTKPSPREERKSEPTVARVARIVPTPSSTPLVSAATRRIATMLLR